MNGCCIYFQGKCRWNLSGLEEPKPLRFSVSRSLFTKAYRRQMARTEHPFYLRTCKSGRETKPTPPQDPFPLEHFLWCIFQALPVWTGFPLRWGQLRAVPQCRLRLQKLVGLHPKPCSWSIKDITSPPPPQKALKCRKIQNPKTKNQIQNPKTKKTTTSKNKHNTPKNKNPPNKPRK